MKYIILILTCLIISSCDDSNPNKFSEPRDGLLIKRFIRQNNSSYEDDIIEEYNYSNGRLISVFKGVLNDSIEFKDTTYFSYNFGGLIDNEERYYNGIKRTTTHDIDLDNNLIVSEYYENDSDESYKIDSIFLNSNKQIIKVKESFNSSNFSTTNYIYQNGLLITTENPNADNGVVVNSHLVYSYKYDISEPLGTLNKFFGYQKFRKKSYSQLEVRIEDSQQKIAELDEYKFYNYGYPSELVYEGSLDGSLQYFKYEYIDE